jgi:hypothetical protein
MLEVEAWFNRCLCVCALPAAAVAVAFKGPPIIKYRLDFGAVPSTVTSVREAASAAAVCGAAVPMCLLSLLRSSTAVDWLVLLSAHTPSPVRLAHLQLSLFCKRELYSSHQSQALSLG